MFGDTFQPTGFVRATFLFNYLIMSIMKKFVSLLVLAMCAIANVYSQPKYEKSIEGFANVGVGKYANSMFGVAFVNGFRLTDDLFVGAGVGVGYMSEVSYVEVIGEYTDIRRSDAYPIPIFLAGKYSLSNQNIAPYVSARVGYTLDINEYLKHAPGLMFEPAFGIDFNISESQSAYLQLGLNFQSGTYSYQKDVYDVLGDWEISIKKELFKSLSIRLGLFF